MEPKSLVAPKRCQQNVYHRDVYRRTGRSPSGFEMHYRREQCKREAIIGRYCWQHQEGGPP